MGILIHVVWLSGLFVFLIGLISLLKPVFLKKMVGICRKPLFLQVAGALKIVLGIMYLIAASACKLPWLIVAIGILVAGGTILFFALGKEKIDNYLSWVSLRALWVCRSWGLVAMAIGALIVYAGIPVK
ncbi:MAG: hypothetical protein AB7F23_00125 [Phycisphaerae bacterium]|jgi:hypothetical protein